MWSIENLQTMLADRNYVAERPLALALFLALGLGRPLFLEGEAGVGKTEVAKVLADGLDRPLIRLQCYEGLDAASALYEWNYPKQLLALKLFETLRSGPASASGSPEPLKPPNLFTEEYLLPRPLLTAIREGDQGRSAVLLIDEIDRADEEFEAFLLEILSDYTVSIPELGTIRATHLPLVIITSNRTREVHDALKRRCLYHWLSYPNPEKEYAIVQARTPELPAELARAVCRFVARLRTMDFIKKPGVAETLDWVRALLLLGRRDLDPETLEETLGCLLKHEADLQLFRSVKTKLASDDMIGLC